MAFFGIDRRFRADHSFRTEKYPISVATINPMTSTRTGRVVTSVVACNSIRLLRDLTVDSLVQRISAVSDGFLAVDAPSTSSLMIALPPQGRTEADRAGGNVAMVTSIY